MRWQIFLVCILLLAGCVKKEKEQQAAEIQPTVYYSTDFSSNGLKGFDLAITNGAAMGVVDGKEVRIGKAVQMRSQGFKSAYATAKNFTMDWGRSYSVSFDYTPLTADNLGYTVYEDRNADLRLEYGSGLACQDNDRQKHLARFDPGKWSKVALDVRPSDGEYDVIVDGELKGTCQTGENKVVTFMFGDADPTDQTYGDGLWANFRITDRPWF